MDGTPPITDLAVPISRPAAADPDDDFDGLDFIRARQIAAKRNALVNHVLDSTDSMLGTGYNKKFVIVELKPEYVIGDDVIYSDPRSKAGATLHRVTAVKPGYVYTKGIHNQNGDGWIPLKDVSGHVTLPKRKM